MHVTESTDVAEYFGSLTPQHTQGMYCYQFLASTVWVNWNFHLSEARRARPDPLCCKWGYRHQGCKRKWHDNKIAMRISGTGDQTICAAPFPGERGRAGGGRRGRRHLPYPKSTSYLKYLVYQLSLQFSFALLCKFFKFVRCLIFQTHSLWLLSDCSTLFSYSMNA
jgi:hypothetical protein